MKNKQLKRFGKILFSLTLIFSSIEITNTHVADAKKSSTPRPSAKPSSKPTSSNPSAKPSSQASSNKPTSNSSSKKSARNSEGSYNKNYNSYNNKGYKRQYTDYINTNYRNSGFFSGNSIINGLLWYTLFNSTASHNHIHASDKQKELVDNVKDSKVPVYMLEIKTKDGEIKHVTVTKEQYDEVKEGDNISLKDGNLEIKN